MPSRQQVEHGAAAGSQELQVDPGLPESFTKVVGPYAKEPSADA